MLLEVFLELKLYPPLTIPDYLRPSLHNENTFLQCRRETENILCRSVVHTGLPSPAPPVTESPDWSAAAVRLYTVIVIHFLQFRWNKET